MTNTAAHHFGLLRAAWSIDAASHAVEVHAANLAASLGREHAVTLCAVKPGTARTLIGLNHFLETYGVRLIFLPSEDGHATRARLIRTHTWQPLRYDPGAVVREASKSDVALYYSQIGDIIQ